MESRGTPSTPPDESPAPCVTMERPIAWPPNIWRRRPEKYSKGELASYAARPDKLIGLSGAPAGFDDFGGHSGPLQHRKCKPAKILND